MNIKERAYIERLKIRMRFAVIMQKKSMNAIGYFVGIVLLIWFVLYPEFSITTEAYRVLDENGQAVECNLSPEELTEKLLEADKDEIVFKSKFWEMISEWGREG